MAALAVMGSLALAACSHSSSHADRTIAFWSFDTDENEFIYAVQPEDRELRKLTRGRGLDVSPSGRLAFHAGWDDDSASIYVIGSDGMRHLIVKNGSEPEWSPDERQIAFVRWVRSDSLDIFVVDVETRTVNRVTTTGRYEQAPAWSPDGAQLAIARTDESGTTSILVMDSDGGNVRELTRPPVRSDDDDPSWSPDGTQIAFDRSIEVGDEGKKVARHVYVVEIDGDGLHRLTPPDGFSYGPEWSPDGTRIAYGSEVASLSSYDIYVVNNDGANTRRLTTTGADGMGAWSPDGSEITFVSARDDPDLTFTQVYVMNADGSNQRRVSQTGTSDLEPQWAS
jgi:Tol biopolymer transport system component